jgi:hypothetical protein
MRHRHSILKIYLKQFKIRIRKQTQFTLKIIKIPIKKIIFFKDKIVLIRKSLEKVLKKMIKMKSNGFKK